MRKNYRLLAVLTFSLMLVACGGKDKQQQTQTQADHGNQVAAVAEKTETAMQEDVQTKSFLMETSMGNITLELDYTHAPISCANFESYVKKGFYDGTIFHRVINNFMIQGGGFTPDMKQKETDAPIQNEATNGLKNEPYTIAMARTNAVHSATSQFFINVKNNDFLNQRDPNNPAAFGYCVFGRVTAGQEVVDQIKAVPTHQVEHYGDVPVEPVLINKVTLVE